MNYETTNTVKLHTFGGTIIRKIGKGSFSDVYLVNKSGCGESEYIVKQIDIDSLVKKYTQKSVPVQSNIAAHSDANTTRGMGISPYDKNMTAYKNNRHSSNSITNHYYTRLDQLVQSEIEVLRRLKRGNNCNIVKYFTHLKTDNVYSLQMEYCKGGDVYSSLRSKKSPVDRNFIIRFLHHVSNAILAIHSEHLIHRDIKLQNILINDDTFKLTDFGFTCTDVDWTRSSNTSNESTTRSSNTSNESTTRSSNTSNESTEINEILNKKYYKLCGTPYYMAPELITNISKLSDVVSQADSQKQPSPFYDKKIDTWSFGICLFELIYNKLPFPKVTSIRDLEAFFRDSPQDYINNQIYKTVNTVNTYTGDKLIELLAMMLQVDPLLRPGIHEIIMFINMYLPIESILSDTGRVSKSCNESTAVQTSISNVRSVNTRSEGEFKSVGLSESWEHLNNSGSVIMKISVGRGFLEWLFSKK